MAQNQKDSPSLVDRIFDADGNNKLLGSIQSETNRIAADIANQPPIVLNELYEQRFAEMDSTRGALSSLADGRTSDKRLSFPQGLGDTDHWVCFRVAEERKFRSKAVKQENTLAYIYLPVPTSLKTGYKSNYKNQELGVIGALTSAGLGDATSGNKDQFNKEAIAGALATDFAKSEAGTLASGLIGNIIGGTTGAIAGGAAAVAANQAVTAGLGNAGIARNPHQAVLFDGTDFRSHSFNYRLIARNRAESVTINKIITAFKYYMAPKISKSTHFFEYPQQFDIDFKNENFLFDIGTSVLTSFDVDYHAQGSPLYFNSGDGDMAPSVVDISMTFQEVTITTKDEIAGLGR
jgi:hypothetical protein